MNGCNNFCSYCIVPFTRGRQKSRSSTAILDECKALIDNGAREITLLGQNVNAFGQDKSGDGTSFAALLRILDAYLGRLPNRDFRLDDDLGAIALQGRTVRRQTT